MRFNFFRISRHPSTSDRLILAAMGGYGDDEITVITNDVVFGSDPTASITEAVKKLSDDLEQQHLSLHGVEVIGPGHVLDALGPVVAGIPRYRAVMARGADGRVLVATGPDGLPLRGLDGRDQLVVERYEICAPAQIVEAAREARNIGSEEGPLGDLPGARLRRQPEAGDIHYEAGCWYLAVAGRRREGYRGDYGGLYARWVDATSLVPVTE